MTIDPSAFIAPGAQVMGRVSIGPDCSIWFGTVIRADINNVTLGKACNIQDGSIVHVSNRWPVVLEDYVSVGHGVILHGCYVEEGALIGMGAIILDGARVGRETVVGAGSLVLEGTFLPPRSLVVGHPARVVRELSAEEVLKYRQVADHYVDYAKKYRS